MSRKVERKLQHVAIAEFQYRHEAELAAGFLSDAGIPFRLQVDDAGGAGLGLSVMHPSVLWVRAVDVEAARALVEVDEADETDEVPQVSEVSQTESVLGQRHGGAATREEPLSGVERAVSGGLAVAFLAVAPNLPPFPLQLAGVVFCWVGGLALLGAAVVGRAPGLLGRLIRMLSGSSPR